jgi:hypothetical protein
MTKMGWATFLAIFHKPIWSTWVEQMCALSQPIYFKKYIIAKKGRKKLFKHLFKILLGFAKIGSELNWH